MGRRPLPGVRDFTRDGRWSTYNVSVLKKMGGRCAQTGHPLKLPLPTKLTRLGHFSPASTLQRKSHLCIPFLGIARPQPQFPHSCVCERFI
jgi:hypothetical protein